MDINWRVTSLCFSVVACAGISFTGLVLDWWYSRPTPWFVCLWPIFSILVFFKMWWMINDFRRMDKQRQEALESLQVEYTLSRANAYEHGTVTDSSGHSNTEVTFIDDRCPDCGSLYFNPGPCGGLAFNIRCVQCASKFWFCPPFPSQRLTGSDDWAYALNTRCRLSELRSEVSTQVCEP